MYLLNFNTIILRLTFNKIYNNFDALYIFMFRTAYVKNIF